MPEFSDPFVGKEELTKEESIQAVRFMIAAEYEAAQMYQRLARLTNNKAIQAVMFDVADEELVHAGEFLRLLHIVEKDEQDLYDEGAAETDKILKED
jgi:rubrerythrin